MNSILSFYRKMYEHELSHAKRLHLHSSRFKKRFHVTDVEELLTGDQLMIPLSKKEGLHIMSTMELMGAQFDLKYFSGIRVSNFNVMGRDIWHYYPLFMFDAEIDWNSKGIFLSIDLESRDSLDSNFPREILQDKDFGWLQMQKELDLGFYGKLKDLVEKYDPDAYTDELLLYPELMKMRDVNKAIKANKGHKEYYFPMGFLGILERENDSYTTLAELKELEKQAEFSAPIQALFGRTKNIKSEKLGILIEELNKSQLIAVENSNERVLSVISGPPGTGKSFTIANIVAEKVSKGQSVLISSKNKEALEVIEEKINKQFGIENLTVNPSKDRQMMEVKNYLDFILGWEFEKKLILFEEIEQKYNEYDEIRAVHSEYEMGLIKNLEVEKKVFADYMHSGLMENTSEVFKDRVLQLREKATIPLWQKLVTYYKGIHALKKFSSGLVSFVNEYKIHKAIKEDRAELRRYQDFLRARKESKKGKEEEVHFETVLEAFPVWLVKANDVSRALKFEKELFDVLIIDEASQCDIPSILPLMQRAKKCVIVGDANQLTHISFVPKVFELQCKGDVADDDKFLCRHRNNSILDQTKEIIDPQAFVRLTEHFRSQLPIISFSNSEFYNDELSILSKRPITTNNHVEFNRSKGSRAAGINKNEIQKIVKMIRDLVDEQVDLDEHLKTSIGVLSPFRKQVDAIFKALYDNFKYEEIHAHQMMVGTAFSFQGNERDMMMISFCLDNKSLGGSYTYLNRRDVFNVSITRARSMQHIFYSFDPENLKADTTLYKFFRHYRLELEDDQGQSTKDEFCLEVIDELEKLGFLTWTKFEISGVQIDLLVKKEDQYLGIDLIGFPGEMEDYYSLERYKMLDRGGVTLLPLPYALWRANRKKCMQAILDVPKEEEILS